jgi:hypothetical protein
MPTKLIIAGIMIFAGITFLLGTSNTTRNSYKFGAIMEKGGDRDDKTGRIICVIIGAILLIAGIILFVVSLK